jgi:hypothetical protein
MSHLRNAAYGCATLWTLPRPHGRRRFGRTTRITHSGCDRGRHSTRRFASKVREGIIVGRGARRTGGPTRWDYSVLF